jgi:undecaprenyl-diphosphatase
MAETALIHALVLGIVEGLTEFLPVSSTGHLILAGDLIGFNGDTAKVFEIVIQTGAVLAIVWEYRARFLRIDSRLWRNLAIAFTPAAVLGLAFEHAIKARLFKPVPVAVAFIVGALVILWAERRNHRVRVEHVDDMTWKDALKVGFAQAFALIPGTSRSGATIIGGMLFGLSRRAATEFSFFLAVPTLIAAGGYDFVKHRALLSSADLDMFAIGLVSAFLAAIVCVRWLIRYVATHDFKPFAWYRIAFGIVVLATAYGGIVNWSAG